MKKLLLMSCVVLGFCAVAEDNEHLSVLRASGEGIIQHDPELMTVLFGVNSVCSKTAGEATNTANTTMNTLRDELQKLIRGNDEKVTASATSVRFLQPESTSYSRNPKGRSSGGYSAWGHVSIKMTVNDRASIIDKFGKLQQTGAKFSNQPNVSVSIDAPVFSVTDDTNNKMQQEAEKLASINFHHDIDQQMALCRIQPSSLRGFNPHFNNDEGVSTSRKFGLAPAAAMARMAAPSSDPVSVNLDPEPVAVRYSFTNELFFKYDAEQNFYCDSAMIRSQKN